MNNEQLNTETSELKSIDFSNSEMLSEFYERYLKRRNGEIDPENDKFLIEDAITEIKIMVSPMLFTDLKEVVKTALILSNNLNKTKIQIIKALNKVNKILDKSIRNNKKSHIK